VRGALETSELRERGLDRLADEIRAHHKTVERHARAMLEEAVAAGEALLEAKGGFATASSCRSSRTAGLASAARRST
jgi:hypothetical protein